MKHTAKKILFMYGLLLMLTTATATAQTDMDGIMMEKNAFCVGPGYAHSSWKKYWEGKLNRTNENLGTVSTQMFMLMGNYGVTRKLNILFGVPYVKTKASAGTLTGLDGIQDLSLFVKYKWKEKRIGSSKIALIGIGGFSFPLTNYVADYLPLSIGSQSKMLSARAMLDYEYLGKWFSTASYTYTHRSNIKIDREAYYTDHMVLSNEVSMPDVSNIHLRAGYRTSQLIVEFVGNTMITHGGFDITRNNMPFPSNRMNATSIGANVKYVVKGLPQLSVVANGSQVIAGRNVGQATTLSASLFYVFDFSKKSKSK